jgi:hypothetical protein
MPAGHGYGVDCLGPQFIGQLAQLAFLETPQMFGGRDLIEEGRLGRLGHQRFSTTIG